MSVRPDSYRDELTSLNKIIQLNEARHTRPTQTNTY